MARRLGFKQSLGRWGEELAAKFLKTQGFQILTRNFRVAGGEIDLIARSKEELIFVEVKTRHQDMAGYPEEAVRPAKVRHLLRAAWWYTQKNPGLPQSWRLDVIAIEINQEGQAQIRWFRNISSQFLSGKLAF